MAKLRIKPDSNNYLITLPRNENNFSVDLIEVGDNIRIGYEGLDELAESIRVNGQLQPVGISWKVTNGKHHLIYGFRRFKAITEILKMDTIKVSYIRKNVNDNEIIQLIENIQRSDLSDYEVAKAIAEIKTKDKTTNKEIAAMIGKSEKWVKDKLFHHQAVHGINIESSTLNKIPTSIITETRALDEAKRVLVLQRVIKNKQTVQQTREEVAKEREKKGNDEKVRRRTLANSIVKIGPKNKKLLGKIDTVKKVIIKIAVSVPKAQKNKFWEELFKFVKNKRQ